MRAAAKPCYGTPPDRDVAGPPHNLGQAHDGLTDDRAEIDDGVRKALDKRGRRGVARCSLPIPAPAFSPVERPIAEKRWSMPKWSTTLACARAMSRT
jgi:hypothetical protein